MTYNVLNGTLSLYTTTHVVSDSRKYDRGLTSLRHDKLHWFDVAEREQYKLCATVHRCRQHKAPQYMIDCCVYTSDIARRQHKAPQYMIDCCVYTSDIDRRQHLRSAGCRQLLVPQHRRSLFGRRAFSVAGPAAWNSSPDYLRDQMRSVDSFCRDLKTLLFSFY